MAALDTNVVVRLIVGDHPAQARAAEKLVAGEPCTIALTVLMECEWVLRSAYALDAKLIAESFRALLALEHIDALDPLPTQRALQGYEAGLDFADAIHATQRPAGVTFATFDKPLVRRASSAGLEGVVLLAG